MWAASGSEGTPDTSHPAPAGQPGTDGLTPGPHQAHAASQDAPCWVARPFAVSRRGPARAQRLEQRPLSHPAPQRACSAQATTDEEGQSGGQWPEPGGLHSLWHTMRRKQLQTDSESAALQRRTANSPQVWGAGPCTRPTAPRGPVWPPRGPARRAALQAGAVGARAGPHQADGPGTGSPDSQTLLSQAGRSTRRSTTWGVPRPPPPKTNATGGSERTMNQAPAQPHIADAREHAGSLSTPGGGP